MKLREIPFTEARQNLSSIVDIVEKTGKPVTIVRHGKAVAVIMSPLEYDQKFADETEWKLAGSMETVKGVDLEKSIKQMRKIRTKAWRKNMEQLAKDLAED